MTSWRNGVSTRVCSGSACSTTPPPAWPKTMFPARTSLITASTSSGSTSYVAAPSASSWLYVSIGFTIAAVAAFASRCSRRKLLANTFVIRPSKRSSIVYASSRSEIRKFARSSSRLTARGNSTAKVPGPSSSGW